MVVNVSFMKWYISSLKTKHCLLIFSMLCYAIYKLKK